MAGSTVAKNNILQIYLTNFNKPSWESVTEDLKVPGSTLKNVTNSQPTASNLYKLFPTQ